MNVTLSISATSIRLLSVKGRRVKKWASKPLSPGLVKDGLILQPKAVGAAIDALFKVTGVPRNRVITSVTGLSFTYRILSLPRMKSALVEEAILRGLRKEVPLPLEELYLSWQAISSRRGEVDYFVLGVSRNLVDAVNQTLAEANVKPYMMDLKALALARAARRRDALIVALEPDCFDIVLVANGIPTVLRTIAPKGEGATLEDNIRQLTNELSRTVRFYNSSHAENPLSPTTPLLLTGELSTDAATSKLIQAEIEYPVEALAPQLEFPSGFGVDSYSTNIGLALKKITPKKVVRFCDINLNLLTDRDRARSRSVLTQYILLTLFLIIAAGLLFPLYQVKSQADAEIMHLQTELSVANQELRQARLVSSEAKQIEDNIAGIAADAQALEQEHQYMLTGGGDFANTLILVTNALPPQAYFTSMKIGNDEINLEGEADNPFRVIAYAMALEAQERFSEVRIVRIGESGAGVSFTIIVRK